MSNTHTTNESLISNKPFVLMRDFVPVASVNYSDLVMVIHPSVPAKDLRKFIGYAKARPGEEPQIPRRHSESGASEVAPARCPQAPLKTYAIRPAIDLKP